MTAASALPRQGLDRHLARLAAKLLRRGRTLSIHLWRKRALQLAYRRGSSLTRGAQVTEETNPVIIETGRLLRDQLLAANQRKHAATGYRVLMLHPSGITADFWFGDLERCMRYAGIECRVLPPDASRDMVNLALEQFQPNVFVAMESFTVLQTLDLQFLRDYKRHHGCLRLFIPVWLASAPGSTSTPQQDAWRRQLHEQGLAADAFFSIFEAEFHDRFQHDPAGPAIEYAAVAQACNPFSDYPVPAVKRHDYFMATSLTDERLEVSYQFLRPILRRYQGLWAGPRWGFGADSVSPADMPRRYAETRIALSPLVRTVHRYGAELTHRVYAAAGCGAFQLTMPTAVTERFFRSDELVQAASPGEYVRLFDHYVGRPRERDAIALAALRRAYGEHTCFHRIDQLVARWDEWRRRGMF